MQRDFCEGGAMPVAGTAAATARVADLLSAYREAGLPIVHVVRLYDGGDVDLVRRTAIAAGAEIVRPGTRGAEVLPELLPEDASPLDPEALLAGETQELARREVAIWKPRWSAFHRTPLAIYLEEQGVNTVVIAGCNFPNCPRATLFDASARDLRTVLVSDATSGIDGRHLREAESVGGVHATSEDLIERLHGVR